MGVEHQRMRNNRMEMMSEAAAEKEAASAAAAAVAVNPDGVQEGNSFHSDADAADEVWVHITLSCIYAAQLQPASIRMHDT